MTAQDYIESKLESLKHPGVIEIPKTTDELIDAIYKLLLSKKFRKYAASPELQQHVHEAIELNVTNNAPINLTFLHGAYKLWRLEESPRTDWAELFSLMYYTNWVKRVSEIYKPGVWFDFFVDDLIVPKLDNVPINDIHTYIDSYQKVVDFLKPYQPANLKMTITTVGSRFESEQAFDESLKKNLEKISVNGLPVLNDTQKAMVELNTKVTDEQLQDPQWREKVFQIHNAYGATKAEPGYHKDRPEKILVFSQSLPMAIAVGSTKDSIMKFWIGVGVLKPRDGSFRQVVMSQVQLANTAFEWQDVAIEGLDSKNFNKIRVLH